MFKQLISSFMYFHTNSQRLADHLWREFSGLPQMKHSEITPFLYLGGQYNLRGLAKLKKHGITAIISMRERPISQMNGISAFKTLHLPTKDLGAPSIEHLQKGIAFIQKEAEHKGKVYIHCHLGEGRGPSMVLAYLMSTGLVLDDAIALIKKVRPFIRPTRPQIEQLRVLEKILLK